MQRRIQAVLRQRSRQPLAKGCYQGVVCSDNHNKTHIVEIKGYGSKGEGIARLEDGRVVFVRRAAKGDICEVQITDETRRSSRAEIARIIEPSPCRVEPDCPVYPMCGGCDFRHIDYEEELRAKLTRVNDALRKIGNTDVRADEIISTGQVNKYRNKAVFHTAQHGGERVIGFYRAETHDICPVKSCLLLPDELNESLRKSWHSPRLEKTVTLRVGTSSNHLTHNLKAQNLASHPASAASHTQAMPVLAELDGLVFRISGKSFFQVNYDAALLLYNKAREYAALPAGATLVDLYCGVGSMTLFIGRDARYALGVENSAEAINDALENARRNGFGNVEFLCADASDWGKKSIRPDCVIVDPPRKGLSASVVRKMLELSPPGIIYISCDPATMARDIALLRGYVPQRVCAVDMFPRTANIECCMLLLRN